MAGKAQLVGLEHEQTEQGNAGGRGGVVVTVGQLEATQKPQAQVDAKKMNVVDRHLDLLVGQTEQYSNQLAHRLASAPATDSKEADLQAQSGGHDKDRLARSAVRKRHTESLLRIHAMSLVNTDPTPNTGPVFPPSPRPMKDLTHDIPASPGGHHINDHAKPQAHVRSASTTLAVPGVKRASTRLPRIIPAASTSMGQSPFMFFKDSLGDRSPLPSPTTPTVSEPSSPIVMGTVVRKALKRRSDPPSSPSELSNSMSRVSSEDIVSAVTDVVLGLAADDDKATTVTPTAAATIDPASAAAPAGTATAPPPPTPPPQPSSRSTPSTPSTDHTKRKIRKNSALRKFKARVQGIIRLRRSSHALPTHTPPTPAAPHPYAHFTPTSQPNRSLISPSSPPTPSSAHDHLKPPLGGYHHVHRCLADYFFVYGRQQWPAPLVRALYAQAELGQVTRSMHLHPSHRIVKLPESTTVSVPKVKMLDRFPKEDYERCPVSDGWSELAFPRGVHFSTSARLPRRHSAVITMMDGSRRFASFLEFDELVPPPSAARADSGPDARPRTPPPVPAAHNAKAASAGNAQGLGMQQSDVRVYAPKTICLVSHYPQFPVFEQCLTQLYLTALKSSMSTTGQAALFATSTPVEAFLRQLLYEVPLPLPESTAVQFCMYENTPAIAPQRSYIAQPSPHVHSLHTPSTFESPPAVKQRGFHKSQRRRSLPVLPPSLLAEVKLGKKVSSRDDTEFSHDRLVSMLPRAVLGWITVELPAVRDVSSSNLPLLPLFQILNVDNILHVLSAMFHEQRILFHSHSVAMLTPVCHTFLQLFYPFQWSYDYIPVLPRAMKHVYQSPRPYIIGMHSQDVATLEELDGVLLVDIDHNCLRCTEPLAQLPHYANRLWTALRTSVERQMSERDFCGLVHLPGSGMAEDQRQRFHEEVYGAILYFYAEICSGFRKFLVFFDEEPYFNQKGFLRDNADKLDPHSLSFLTNLVQSNAFYVFLTQEVEKNLYHDYIATGKLEVLHEILQRERQPLQKIVVPPPIPPQTPASSGDEVVSSADVETKQAVLRDLQPSPDSVPNSTTHSQSPSSLSAPVAAHTVAQATVDVASTPTSVSMARAGWPLRPAAEPAAGKGPFTSPLDESLLTQRRSLPYLEKLAERYRHAVPLASSPRRAKPAGMGGSSSNVTARKRMERHLALVFDFTRTEQLSSQDMADVLECARSEEARRRAADILTQPTLHQLHVTSMCLPEGSFARLLAICRLLLNACDRDKDYCTAASVWDASNRCFCRTEIRTIGKRRFFSFRSRSSGSGRAVGDADSQGSASNTQQETCATRPKYLHVELKGHQLWHDTDFWQVALDQTVQKWRLRQLESFIHRGDEAGTARSQGRGLRSLRMAQQHTFPQSGRGKLTQLDEPPSKELAEYIVEWIVSAMNYMCDCGVAAPVVKRIVQDMGQRYKLPANELHTLFILLGNIGQAMAMMKKTIHRFQ